MDLITMLPAALAYVAGGAFLYRLRGAGWEQYIPFDPHAKTLCTIYFTLPILLLTWGLPWHHIAIPFAATFGLLMVTLRSGHGDWLDMGRVQTSGDPGEKLNFLIDWVSWERNESGAASMWHDRIGMFLSGAYNMLPLSLAFGILVNPWLLLLIPLFGLAKSLSYELGWHVANRGWTMLGAMNSFGSTWGEFFTGAAFSLVIVITLINL